MSEKIQNAHGDTVVEIGDSNVPVHVAWSRVMGEVTSLGKEQRHDSPGAKFNFRGIDDVMNLVGPVLRKHGVSVIPFIRSIESRDFTNKSGNRQHEVMVMVSYTVIGPDGDTFEGSAPGESADSSDKATSKAMSVAYRTFLLQSLCLPTDEPDPDHYATDRSPANPKQEEAQKTAAGLLAGDKDLATVERVKTWAEGKELMDEAVVVDDKGSTEPLSRLFERTLAGLGDTTADTKAEQVLRDSLGATEVPAEEPKTEEVPA